MDTGISVRDHGAVGDGTTDDTAAIRNAMSRLPEKDGVLFFPPGHYRTDVIELRSFTTYLGHSAWAYSFRQPGGTVISPLWKEQPCLFFGRDSRATRFRGLTLRGTVEDDDPTAESWERAKGSQGQTMDGILTDGGGDQLVVDDCRIERFSGNGIRLQKRGVWAVRHSLVLFNGGFGITGEGAADSWVLDTQITTNRRGGVWASGGMTVTGCRIEHNVTVGAMVGSSAQLVGNVFCCNEGPALLHEGVALEAVTVTGNIFRHVPGQKTNPDPALSCHVRVFDLVGFCFTGNTLFLFDQDGATKSTGLILGRLRDSVVANNTLFHAATEELIRDEGGHTNTIVENNPGSLLRRKATSR